MTTPTPLDPLVRRHLRWGWTLLLVFLTFGTVLESLHGFRIAAYLDVEQGARRHVWTLAHAHGTLFGLLHLGLASTIAKLKGSLSSWRWPSRALTAATWVIPCGFFLAGFGATTDEPGLAILAVPVGAATLIYAAAATLIRVRRDA